MAADLTPNPRVSIAPNQPVAYPGDEIAFVATVDYHEATLAVTADLLAENAGDVTGVVSYASVVWERREVGQGTWTPFAGASMTAPGWMHGEITLRLPDDGEVVFDELADPALETLEMGEVWMSGDVPYEVAAARSRPDRDRALHRPAQPAQAGRGD